jgi:hypothetical protein
LAVIFVTTVLLDACSPSLNWRTVALPDTDLQAVLPCRPGRYERAVEVAGRSLKMFMLSCEAGGVTYALSTADVGDSGPVDATLAALLSAARDAIHGSGTATAWQPQGATPFPNSVSARLQGMRPDGSPVAEAIQVFGRGTRIYEAIAIGQDLAAASTQPFQDALRFPAAP